jgi:uncharacterized RDD family membrane protein YckC
MVLDDIFHPGPAPERPAKSRASLDSQLASPVDRGAAVVADMVVFFPLMALAISPFRRMALEAQILGDQDAWFSAVMLAFGAAFLAFVAYQTAFLALMGATPGKRFIGLKVVTVWEQRRPNGMEAFLRSLTWCCELVLLGLPWLAVFSNEKRRPFHDRIADTAVVVVEGKRSAGGLPTLPEMSIASGFQASFMTVVTAILFIQLLQPQSSTRDRLIAELEEKGKLCSEVSEARGDFGKDRSRLEVALSLYAADSLSESCLKKEADFSLWRSHEKGVAYLAKALTEAGDEPLYERYLEKACPPEEASGDVCRAVTLVRGNSALAASVSSAVTGEEPPAFEGETDEKHDEDSSDKIQIVEREREIEAVVSSLGPESPAYLKIWTVQILMDSREYGRALDILESIPPHRKIGAFVTRERAKALWQIGQKSEARVVMRAAADLLPAASRVDLVRWFCSHETAESSCGSARDDEPSSCSLLGDAIERSSRWLSKPEVAATHIRSERCLGKLSQKRIETLLEQITDSGGRGYLEALMKLEGEESEKALGRLKKIATGRDGRGPFYIEANLRLVELAPSIADLTPVRERWMDLEPTEEGWKQIGEGLMARLGALEAWDQAVGVGLRMLESEKHDRQLHRAMVILAFKSGNRSMASGLLESLSRLEADAVASVHSARQPASAPSEDEFRQIVEQLAVTKPAGKGRP